MNLADGAVRSGKTVGNFFAFAEHCVRGPAGDLMVVGKTERTVKRNVVQPMQDMWPAAVRYVEGAGELWVFGRRCYVVGASDAHAYTKVQGATLAGAYANELALYPESMLQTIVDRCSVPGSKVFGDCNPQGPFHWLYANYLTADLPKRDLKRWRFTLDDNPALAEEYKARLKRVHTGVWYKRNVLGEWVIAEGAIYDFFEADGPMVVDLVPTQFERVIVSADYGTSNATVFGKLGLYRGTWILFDEYYHDSRASGYQKTDFQYANEFLEWLAPHNPSSVEIDPSAASFKLALKHAGVSRVRDADNEVLDGIRTVARLFSEGKLKIAKRCEKTIESVASYSWDPKAQERGEDKPLKQADHGADMLRYGCMRAAGKRGAAVLSA